MQSNDHKGNPSQILFLKIQNGFVRGVNPHKFSFKKFKMGVLYFFMGKSYHVFIYLFMHYDEFYILFSTRLLSRQRYLTREVFSCSECDHPSHLFFDDDANLFAKKFLIRNIVSLFDHFSRALGQNINLMNSRAFYSSSILWSKIH